MQLFSIFPHILAYIDPGTGSIILQAAAAVVAGAAIAAKFYWYRIMKFFGVRQKNNSDPSEAQADDEK